MNRLRDFMAGFLVAAVILGSAVWVSSEFGRRLVPQVPFDSGRWKVSDVRERGAMKKSLVALLEKERPNQEAALALLGPPTTNRGDYLNYADICLEYHYDAGQRMGGLPYLNKLGLAFDKDGKYLFVTSWD